MSTILPHMSLSANLECMSEMCRTRLAENTGRKNYAKNRLLRTVAQLCRAIYSQLRHISTIEMRLLNSNISSTCTHNMVNFRPLAAEIGSGVWGPLQISTGFASWQCYCTASSSGRQLNFAALNRGRHLCSAGRPSGWALAHILVMAALCNRGPLHFCSVVSFFFLSIFFSFLA